MTDKKLDEIRRRHEDRVPATDDEWGESAHADRAYLLARVEELENQRAGLEKESLKWENAHAALLLENMNMAGRVYDLEGLAARLPAGPSMDPGEESGASPSLSPPVTAKCCSRNADRTHNGEVWLCVFCAVDRLKAAEAVVEAARYAECSAPSAMSAVALKGLHNALAALQAYDALKGDDDARDQ